MASDESDGVRLLRQMRFLLSGEDSRWVQFTDAVSATGQRLEPATDGDDAVKFSIVGAWRYVTHRAAASGRYFDGTQMHFANVALCKAMGTDSYSWVDWNDTAGRTHADVMAAIDAALIDLRG